MGIGDKQPCDEILVARAHAGTSLAAAALRPIDGQRHTLDIAAMADRNDHVFLLDQVFVILIEHLVGDLGAPVVGQALARGCEFLENDLVNARLRSEDFEIIRNPASKLASFLGQLLALHPGQALQPQIEDRAGLCLGQLIMTVDNFMARVVDQSDKGLDLARRPGTGA